MTNNLIPGLVLPVCPLNFSVDFTSTTCYKLRQAIIVCNFKKNIYDPNSIKWQNTSFWTWFRPVGPKFSLPNAFLKNLASPVTRYHDQLSSCAISEKTNDPILRKLGEGWTMNRWTDRQKDKNDFIGHCPTNIECSKCSFY